MNSTQIKLKIRRIAVFVLVGMIFAAVLGWANSGEAMGRNFSDTSKKIKILPAGMRGDSEGWQNGVEIFAQDLGENANANEFKKENSAFFYDGLNDKKTGGDINVEAPIGDGNLSNSEQEPAASESNSGGGSTEPEKTEAADSANGAEFNNSDKGSPTTELNEIVPVTGGESAPGTNDQAEINESASEGENTEPAITQESGDTAQPESEPAESSPSETENPEPETPTGDTLLVIVGEEVPEWMNNVPTVGGEPTESAEESDTTGDEQSGETGSENTDEEVMPEESSPLEAESAGEPIEIPEADGEAPSVDEPSSGEKQVAESPKLMEPSPVRRPFKKSFTLSKFALDSSVQVQSVESLQLRFSMGANEPASEALEPNYLAVQYSNNGKLWADLEKFNLNEGLSNSTNGGYFLAALPVIQSFDELRDMEIRFVFEANMPGSDQTVYIDAVWLEAIYTAPPTADELAEQKREQILDKYYRGNEDPAIVFGNLKNKKNFLEKVWAWIKGEKREIKAKLVNPRGEEFTEGVNIEGETVKITNSSDWKFRPGRYRIEVTVEEGENEEIETQYFEWGVLTVNTDKSLYKTGDTANIYLGILNNYGHTVCDADIILSVTDPDGNKSFPVILSSDDCGMDNVTDKPDYAASYYVASPGSYKIDVIATTESGTMEITDIFEAHNSVDFDVVRTGPTRINPAAAYSMNFNVIAGMDFKGKMIEYVPADFEIYKSSIIDNLSSEGGIIDATSTVEFLENTSRVSEGLPSATTTIEIGGKVTTIAWDVDMKAGQAYNFSYTFMAPPMSPYIFRLGPLQIGNFTEARQWQIASDAVIASVAGGGNWNTTGTWTGGVVPGSGDAVTITCNAGAPTVTVDINNAAAASLVVCGTSSNSYASTLAFNSGSQLTVSGNVTIGTSNKGSGHINMTNGGTLKIGGAVTISKAGTWTPGTSTVEYTGSGAQTVGDSAFFTSFYNLTASGGGTKTTGGALTVSNNFIVGDSATFAIAGYNFTASGTTTVGGGTSGTLSHTSTTGTKIFTGLVTINAGATWNNSANEAVTFRGGITNAGTFTAGSGIQTFDTNAQTLTCTAAISIPSLTVTTIAATHACSETYPLTVSTALTGTGTIKAGTSSYLKIGGTSATITFDNTTNTPNTVDYYGSGAQTIRGITYNNLKYTGSNTGTLGGAITVNGDMTISSGTVATGNYGVTWNGNFTNSGTFTGGSSAITIGGTSTTPGIAAFTTTGGVTFSRTSSTATLNGNVTAASLTINGSGGTLNLGTSKTHTFSGNVTLTAGTLNGGSSTLKVAGSLSGTGATFTANTGTVNFNSSSSQTIPAYNFYNLTSSSTGNRTMASSGTVGIAGVFTPGVNEYLTSGTETIEFNGSGEQTIPVFNYNNLTSSNSGARILGSEGITQIGNSLG